MLEYFEEDFPKAKGGRFHRHDVPDRFQVLRILIFSVAALTYTCLLQHVSLLQKHTKSLAFTGNRMLLHKLGYLKVPCHCSCLQSCAFWTSLYHVP